MIRDSSSVYRLKVGVLLMLVYLAGCQQIKQTALEADQDLREFFGTSEKKAEKPPSYAEASDVSPEILYRQAKDFAASGNNTESIARLKEAAIAGHGQAAFDLATAYREGVIVQRDQAQADRWLRRAADLGHVQSLYVVATNYAEGRNGLKNPRAAASYYEKAALLGHSEAQFQLGEAYSKGNGVKKDLPWGLRWYGMAAYQGHSDAQFAYGVLVATGRGMPKDPALGYQWVRLAEMQGHLQASEVSLALASQIDEAKRRQGDIWADSFRQEQKPALDNPPTVSYIQVKLSQLGFDPGPVDGQTGPKTKTAIKNYQEARSLPRDGKISNQLLELLLAEQVT